MNFAETLKKACAVFDIIPDNNQINLMQRYFELLVEQNKTMNLTAIVDEQQAAILHFSDSLSLLKYVDIPEGSRFIDVGTGAGFPGMPLKIMRPDLDITLLDSLNKRLNFLDNVSNELNLGIKTLHLRAEDAGKNPDCRESFDFASARAVAKLNVLIEYCLPLLKVGGMFIAMKAGDIEEELKAADNALTELNGEIAAIESFELLDGAKRNLVIIRKNSQSSAKYPRSAAKISKKPL